MDITVPAKMAQPTSFMDFTLKYIQAMNIIDLNITKEMEQTRVEKYWKCAGLFEIEYVWLYNLISALVKFMRHL